ncbi:cutinase family protein [Streptomyces collinus]|uniref:cutinase family protein n=1 Tax=Streptomyces collinus TaxID=42684 RepID=UPI003447ED50
MKFVYVPGFQDETGGDWATGPLREALGNRVTVLGDAVVVDHPAWNPGGGGNAPGVRPEVIKIGRENLIADLANPNRVPADACIVLIGYSTGVPIIERALRDISAEVGDRIVAVELFADPYLALRPADRQEVPAAYANRVRYECNVEDIFCSGNAIPQTSEKCLDELRQARFSNLGGPCLTPEHLPQAYGVRARRAALWAAGGFAGASASVTVEAGDTLWDLAESHLDVGANWTEIYDANQSLIEETAQAHGLPSSAVGHWIFPGTPLIIPST